MQGYESKFCRIMYNNSYYYAVVWYPLEKDVVNIKIVNYKATSFQQC
jgi:DNA-directed RNA polymerase subunit E'/Rpb7